MKKRSTYLTAITGLALEVVLISFYLSPANGASRLFSPEDVLKTKRSLQAEISPDGRWIAYTVSVQRKADEEPGPAYSELYLVSTEPGEIRPFITGEVAVSSPLWSPDGSAIAFLTKRRGKDAKKQVWLIPRDGGESVQVTRSETGVISFRWHPKGEKLAYIATTPRSKREKALGEKGYGFIFYEENLKHRNLYLSGVSPRAGETEAEQITEGVTVWSFEFSPDGKTVAAGVSEKNLIDQRYVFQRIELIDLESKERKELIDPPGKLGNFSFSPDGSRIAYAAASKQSDHAVSQVYVVEKTGGQPRNLTPPDFRGHVDWVGWKDNKTIVYRASEGVWNTLSTVKAGGGKRKVILDSRETGMIFARPSYTRDFKRFAMVGSSPDLPGEVYYWKRGKQPRRLTTLNPWIAERKLGSQEVFSYPARDQTMIEGIIIYPVDYEEGKTYPLIVVVHGGPESRYSNGWLTTYFHPVQVFAGKGYIVFLPNYRSSTGYGVAFTKEHMGDAAGKEFDDIADGIRYLVDKGIADPERVGLGGGSYGGFAAAWFASRYTELVRSVVMFVGISDLISKRGTTDIPFEELFVHSGKKLEDMWKLSLERSPIYWAHQSNTAVLILGGTSDTRVHPSQSLEFYRRLKMNGHPAVRLVQYPGEGHGNRKQPGRIDVLYRVLQWYDWYVRDKKPLEGPMPPRDVSESYGLEIEE